MAWFSKWDYNFDLSKGGVELSFRHPDEMASLLVENEAIRRVSKIINDTSSMMLSSRHYLIGSRGLGKSTILNYVAYSLFTSVSEKKIIPVYVSLLGEASSEQELERFFFRSCLEGVLDLSTTIPIFIPDHSLENIVDHISDAVIEYKRQLRNLGDVSLEFICTAFENQLRHLSERFVKTIFLIDGLDKQDTKIVLSFFRNTQERFNTLITKFNCVFIDAADPSWRDTLETKEFSGVRGVSITLRGWTLDEVKLLIRKRMESVGIFKIPFQEETLQTLVEDFHGNPREILQHATALLHFAARQRIETVEPRIARTIVWREEAKQKLFDSIVSEPDLQFAYQKLKSTFDAPQLMNILVATYGTEYQRLYVGLDYERRSSMGITVSDSEFQALLQILINKGCLRRSKHPNHVELEQDILKIFGIVKNLRQPLITLPVVLADFGSKIRILEPAQKADVSLKSETEAIFQQNSRAWLTYENIRDLLLDNPKRRKMFETYFGDDYSKKILSTIPLIVGQLMQQGNLLKDCETNCFRWRPNIIDEEISTAMPYRSLLDSIQQAKEETSQDLETAIKHCRGVYSMALLKLDSIFNKGLSNLPTSRVESFLRNLSVETEQPIPLGLFSSMLESAPAKKEEADLIVNATIIYARRILNKYQEFEGYERIALDKVDKISRCTVGRSKTKERQQFQEIFLPVLTRSFGNLIEFMDKMKQNGFADEIPANLAEFRSQLYDKVLLKGRLLACPKCGKSYPVASTGEILTARCSVDRVPLASMKEVFLLANDAYQAWNVWIEEYVQCVLQDLPCRNIGSGICVRPHGASGVATSYEVDGIVTFKAQSVSVECVENVSCGGEKNDLVTTIAKTQTLGLFDALILVYRRIDDQSVFDSIVDRHRRLIYPVIVQSMPKFKDALLSALDRIKEASTV